MQFKDLSKNSKLGIKDFRKFVSQYKNYSLLSKDILKKELLYFLLWRSYPNLFWKYSENFSLEKALKDLNRPELDFVFDLARKKNYWLKDKQNAI